MGNVYLKCMIGITIFKGPFYSQYALRWELDIGRSRQGTQEGEIDWQWPEAQQV